MTERFDKDYIPQPDPEMQELEKLSLDELLRETQEDLDRYDALVTGQQPPQEPAAEETGEFQPQLPREYAELTVEAEQQPQEEETDPEEEEEELEEEQTPSGWRGLPFGIRTFIYVASVLIISMALAFGVWILADDVCALTGTDREVVITVPEDFTIDEVAEDLQAAGLIEYKWLFKLYCSYADADDKILPGSYTLNELQDYHALVLGMASTGERATVGVTIPEGYECREIFALLEEKGVCSAEKLWETAANEDFMYAFLDGVELGDPNRLEGCLFPDTYEFYVNDNPRNVLNKFLRNTDKKLTQELWTALDALNEKLKLPEELTMHDILIVASLIEKEAANSQETAVISSVIYNRLRSERYACLNIDATIQYILPERKEQLSLQDTYIDSPYNTYKYPGLPIGAIANPGMTAIRGALFPKDTEYYFYALGKDGLHQFFRTYNEHIAFLEKLKNA